MLHWRGLFPHGRSGDPEAPKMAELYFRSRVWLKILTGKPRFLIKFPSNHRSILLSFGYIRVWHTDGRSTRTITIAGSHTVAWRCMTGSDWMVWSIKRANREVEGRTRVKHLSLYLSVCLFVCVSVSLRHILQLMRVLLMQLFTKRRKLHCRRPSSLWRLVVDDAFAT